MRRAARRRPALVQHPKRGAEHRYEQGPIKSWKAIGEYLGQPQTTIKRWAEEGMPVKRDGRYVEADPAELSAWLARESGVRKPVHIAPEADEITRDLKEAVALARRGKMKRVK